MLINIFLNLRIANYLVQPLDLSLNKLQIKNVRYPYTELSIITALLLQNLTFMLNQETDARIHQPTFVEDTLRQVIIDTSPIRML